MILAPDGVTHARAETMPMTLGQVHWFTNGHAFLRHVSDLHSLRLKAVCVRCYNAGLPETISVTSNPEQMSYVVRCACSGERVLPASYVKSTDELLTKQGWQLACDHQCAAWGMADGVEANNSTTSETVTIRCGCTLRRYSMPKAVAKAVVH